MESKKLTAQDWDNAPGEVVEVHILSGHMTKHFDVEVWSGSCVCGWTTDSETDGPLMQKRQVITMMDRHLDSLPVTTTMIEKAMAELRAMQKELED